MKLQEILDDVDTLIPNTLTNEVKIRWINQVQRQLYREYPLIDVTYPFVTVPNQAFYELPSDCPENRITQVVIGEEEYPFQAISDNAAYSKFWTFVSGLMMIYPTPPEAFNGFIYYKPRPLMFTVDNLDTEPTFPEDFHELLVYGCAARVAKAQQDVALANNFFADFEELSSRAKKYLQRPEFDVIEVI